MWLSSVSLQDSLTVINPKPALARYSQGRSNKEKIDLGEIFPLFQCADTQCVQMQENVMGSFPINAAHDIVQQVKKQLKQ